MAHIHDRLIDRFLRHVSWRPGMLAAVVLVLGLGSTALGWVFLRDNEAEFRETRAQTLADSLVHRVQERLGKVDFVLRGAVGLFGAQRLVERHEFESYLNTLQVKADLPEVVGVGLAPRVTAQERASFEAGMSASYQRSIRIRPGADGDPPALAFPISFFWPINAQTLGVVGYDGYSDARRRGAMQTALNEDVSAMSGGVQLRIPGWTPGDTGVLLYRAVHASLVWRTEGRHEGAQDGLIALGLNLSTLFRALQSDLGLARAILVTDVEGGKESVLVDLRAAGIPEGTPEGAPVLRDLHFGARTWRLAVWPHDGDALAPVSTVVALAGSLGSVLLALLVASLAGQQQRAQRLAEDMTTELRASETRFELAVSASDEGIWEWLPGRSEVFLSPRCDRLLRGTYGVLPRRLRALLRQLEPASRHEFLAAFRAHVRGQAVLDCVLPIRRGDGSTGSFHLTGKSDFDPAGRPLRTAGAISDVTALRRAQQAVVDSHAKLDSLYRDASLGMALVDERGRILQANREFCRLSGFRESELKADPCPLLTPEEYAEADARALSAALDGAPLRPYEKDILRRDGQRLPVLTTVTAVAGSGGLHWILLEDVSVRKAEQHAIREAHATNESLIAAMPDMLFQLDERMRVVRYHAADGQELSMAPQEFLGRSLTEALSPDMARRFIETARAASHSEGLHRIEYRSSRGGRVRHFEARFRAVGTGGTLAVIRDMTDLKEAEMALRASEARWQFALDGAGDGVWDWNVQSGAVFRSKRCLAMLGYAPGEVGDAVEAWMELVHPDDLDSMLATQAAHLQGEAPAFAHELRLRCQDGRYKWILARGLVVERDQDGMPLRMIGTYTDIDDAKAREAEILDHNLNLASLVEARTKDLLHAKEVAEAANEAKSVFLANMSHELRTPMHGVLSYARLGEARVHQVSLDKLKDYFSRIRTSGERLLALLNDLLDLSKFEAGRMVIQVRPLQLGSVVTDVVHEFEALSGSRNLEMTLEEAPDLPLILADSERIAQVVRNLVSNAIKFTADGRRIAIRLDAGSLPGGGAEGRPAVVLSVSDQGVGIPPEELDEVFEKFVQSSRTRTGAGGTGLGLAICKEIVTAHEGEITARNNPAGGAEFRVMLPAMREPAGLPTGETEVKEKQA